MALKGIRVIELAGLAPVPLCGMILSDFGAEVIRVDKIPGTGLNYDVTARGKKSLALNLKKIEAQDVLKRLCSKSDVILDPFRPGVMESFGLAPRVVMEDNSRLIYARLTGFGQSGPYKNMAGHDINYLAISGLLSKLGRKDENPYAPVNLLADFAGGSMTCAMGIMAALYERSRSSRGQIIDCNMTEGAAYVGSWIYQSQKMFVWPKSKERGSNFLDSGSHFYETYKTKDGKFVAVGALEPQFYSELLRGLGFTEDELPQFGGDGKSSKEKLAAKFSEKTRDEWAQIFDKIDACVTPVLDLDEAPLHKQNVNSFVKTKSGEYSPIPAPRLSRTPGKIEMTGNDLEVGKDTRTILCDLLGYSHSEVDALEAFSEVIYCPENEAKK